MRLLNMKTAEEYVFVPSGDEVISWKTSEWLELPVNQAQPQDMLPCMYQPATMYNLHRLNADLIYIYWIFHFYLIIMFFTLNMVYFTFECKKLHKKNIYVNKY